MVKTFAAIDIGSYELSMKIYEVTKKNGIKQIDYIKRPFDMGTETYATGKLSSDRVLELCAVLSEFRKIMKSYRTEDYVAYGTSAIRETVNSTILLSQIYERTGIRINILSNSEQRFLDYKSIAFQGQKFLNFIEKGTAICDVGGGSVQLSLFNKDTLISTENIRLGVLRVLDRLHTMGASLNQYEYLVGELAEALLSVYKKLYLKDREIENLILIDDYVAPLICRGIIPGVENGITDLETIDKYIETFKSSGKQEMAHRLQIAEEEIPAIYASLLILKNVMLTTGAVRLWAPGVTLCDGIAYEYAEKNDIVRANHSFEDDIVASAMQISKRYMGSRKRAETLENIALNIFDNTKDIHGLSDRDRLLLRICAILHDCGKYVSMENMAECSYNIIMSTEIIGLSHKERMIIANTVKFNQLPFEYFDEMVVHEAIEREDHMRIAKLTAILRLSNGLDRSHKMKFKDIKVEVSGDNLFIDVETDTDVTLEKGLFGYRAEFFNEVFNLTPVIRQHRSF